MKAALKDIYSLELDEPLREYRPPNPKNFGILVRMMIGPDSLPGAESFDLFVCSPNWIENNCDIEKFMWGFHTLIVLEFDGL